MKHVNKMFAWLATAVLATSCLNDNDTYRAGFVFEKPASAISSYFANNTGDSLVFFSYGNWALKGLSGYNNSWVTIPVGNGKGNTVYCLQAEFKQNTTGEGRYAAFRVDDTDHPGEANYSFLFFQFATRGDGSLGNAADVKKITGSEGSVIELEYDDVHRPTSLMMRKNDIALRNISFTYNNRDSLMRIDDEGTTYQCSYGKDFQPGTLRTANDTIEYTSRYYPNGIPASANYIFNFEQRHAYGSTCVTYRFPDNGVSLTPDSLHNADSLFYYNNGVMTEKLGLTYSADDNRKQSVDVNQLLHGIEQCDPYLLLSLYRYARNTSIIATAKSEHDTYVVTTTLNSDRSVHTMTVTCGKETVTYTFEY